MGAALTSTISFRVLLYTPIVLSSLFLFPANLIMGMVDQERFIEVNSEMSSENVLGLGYKNPFRRSAKTTWIGRQPT